MKNIYLLLLASLAIYPTEILAQDCQLPTAQTDLEINNVRARLKTGGDLWWDGNNGRYIVPKPDPPIPEISALFAGGLWIGGFDQANNFKLAAQTYGTASGSTDYWPGYLDETGSVTEEVCSFFDRFWETNSMDIDAFLADRQDNGVLDEDVPPSILAWPAKGNPEF
jgi:hypothetical protein